MNRSRLTIVVIVALLGTVAVYEFFLPSPNTPVQDTREGAIEFGGSRGIASKSPNLELATSKARAPGSNQEIDILTQIRRFGLRGSNEPEKGLPLLLELFERDPKNPALKILIFEYSTAFDDPQFRDQLISTASKLEAMANQSRDAELKKVVADFLSRVLPDRAITMLREITRENPNDVASSDALVSALMKAQTSGTESVTSSAVDTVLSGNVLVESLGKIKRDLEQDQQQDQEYGLEIIKEKERIFSVLDQRSKDYPVRALEMAKIAFEQGDMQRAKLLLSEPMAKSEPLPDFQKIGVVHESWTLAGVIALMENDEKFAITALENSFKGIDRTENVAFFHPCRDLADRLLKLGKKEEVLVFLNEVSIRRTRHSLYIKKFQDEILENGITSWDPHYIVPECLNDYGLRKNF